MPRERKLNGVKVLYHITHASNYRSILRSGLLISKSTSVQRVWLCVASLIPSIHKHLAIHHRAHAQEFIHFRVEAEESTLTPSGRPGILYSYHDIPAAWLSALGPISQG